MHAALNNGHKIQSGRILLWAIAIIFIFIAMEETRNLQGLIFSVGIIAVLYKEKLVQITNSIKFPYAFFVVGLFFGILTEIFAIMGNADLPPEQKVLLNPYSISGDLLVGIAWYGLFLCTWYVLLRKYEFSITSVLISSGIFGILTENGGAIALGVFINPITGILLAVLIGLVYAIFPSLAYMTTKHRFPDRHRARIRDYGFIVIAFFIFWAIYGNFIHPFLFQLLK